MAATESSPPNIRLYQGLAFVATSSAVTSQHPSTSRTGFRCHLVGQHDKRKAQRVAPPINAEKSR
eukprot:7758790-Alexandrium_andersonii.AAC.1